MRCKQATGFLRPLAADAVSFACVESKLNSFDGGDFFVIMNFRFCISQRCVYRAKGEEEIVRSGSVLPSGKERCLGVIWGGMGVRRERTGRFGAGGYGERGAASPLKRR